MYGKQQYIYCCLFLFENILIFQFIKLYNKLIGQIGVMIKYHSKNKVLLAWVIYIDYRMV